jgi:hypothetical protein
MSDTIHILSEGGTVYELSLPLHEVVEDKLAKGSVRRVNPDGSPFTEPSEVPAPPTSRPALAAAKGEWVAWAVVKGLTPDDAEALTKADLIERFGAGNEPGSTPETGTAPEGTPAE